MGTNDIGKRVVLLGLPWGFVFIEVQDDED